LPETSKIGDGIRRAFREADPVAREAGRRWGREIQQGLGEARIGLQADPAKASAEIDSAARDRHSTVHLDVDRDELGRMGATVATSVAAAGVHITMAYGRRCYGEAVPASHK
jgi:hypothetical protein